MSLAIGGPVRIHAQHTNAITKLTRDHAMLEKPALQSQSQSQKPRHGAGHMSNATTKAHRPKKRK